MKLFRSLCTASFLALMTVGTGCGSDDADTNMNDGKTISSLEIETGITTLSKGSSITLKAMAKYADGSSEDVTSNADTVWNTSDPEVATVDERGNVTAVDEGGVDITVKFMGKEAEESFVVTP